MGSIIAYHLGHGLEGFFLRPRISIKVHLGVTKLQKVGNKTKKS